MWILSSALEILTANRIERHGNVEFPHNALSCPLGLTNTAFKKALWKPEITIKDKIQLAIFFYVKEQ